ncbi:MAG: ParB/RepB/Spo0J family partition protein [Candidatus Moranbacteria bacterium]|nr:ParB/RepB/Spo0J family partition protein [Candidatus Moranbacteria bacterium]
MARSYGLGRGLSSLIPQKSDDSSVSSVSRRTPSRGGQVETVGEKANYFSAQSVRRSKVDDALIPFSSGEKKAFSKEGSVQMVAVKDIIPNTQQPRTHFDEARLEELSLSIKQHGVIQPLAVVARGDRFELIAGERRWRASQRAGLTMVPVFVRERMDERVKLEVALIENIQRHDLGLLEEARAYRKLSDDFSLTQEEIAKSVGKSRSVVANRMRLLDLPVEAQRALEDGEITEGHAKVILGVENLEKRRALFELIVKEKLTVRQAEEKTQEISVRPHTRRSVKDPDIVALESRLRDALGTKVRVTSSGDRGKVLIEYFSSEELQTLLDRLKV